MEIYSFKCTFNSDSVAFLYEMSWKSLACSVCFFLIKNLDLDILFLKKTLLLLYGNRLIIFTQFSFTIRIKYMGL